MSAVKSFPMLLEDLTHSKDTKAITGAQRKTLHTYEETNEMLRQFLDLSANTHKVLLENFTTHTKTLATLKKDLESSFKRIRTLKQKLRTKYPDAFEATSEAIRELEDQYKLEDDESYEYKSSNISTQETELENHAENSENMHEDVGINTSPMKDYSLVVSTKLGGAPPKIDSMNIGGLQENINLKNGQIVTHSEETDGPTDVLKQINASEALEGESLSTEYNT